MKKGITIGISILFVITSLTPMVFGYTTAVSYPSSNPQLLLDSNEPPIADVGGPYGACVNEEILFNGSGSYDPDGVIVSYEWYFGDGDNGTGENTSHAYQHPGHYTVILTVTDDDGAIDNDTTIAYINGPPESPWIDGPTFGEIEVEYIYTFVSTDIDGDDVFYWIDWGDGNDTGWIGPYMAGEEITRSHSWSENGTYEIRAKAKDIWCESYWSFLFVRIGDYDTYEIDIDGPTRGRPGITYYYNFSIGEYDGDTLWLDIYWGDGTYNYKRYESGDNVTVGHCWEEKGTYGIKARAESMWGEIIAWGELVVTMPRYKVLTHSLFLWFLERFPLLERLLNLI